jgi:hypothetical protein
MSNIGLVSRERMFQFVRWWLRGGLRRISTGGSELEADRFQKQTDEGLS